MIPGRLLTRDPVARMTSVASSTRSPPAPGVPSSPWSATRTLPGPSRRPRPATHSTLFLPIRLLTPGPHPPDDLVLAGRDHRVVDRRLAGHAGRPARGSWPDPVGEVGRLEERLGRDAAAVEARAADLVLVDEGDLQARAGPPGRPPCSRRCRRRGRRGRTSWTSRRPWAGSPRSGAGRAAAAGAEARGWPRHGSARATATAARRFAREWAAPALRRSPRGQPRETMTAVAPRRIPLRRPPLVMAAPRARGARGRRPSRRSLAVGGPVRRSAAEPRTCATSSPTGPTCCPPRSEAAVQRCTRRPPARHRRPALGLVHRHDRKASGRRGLRGRDRRPERLGGNDLLLVIAMTTAPTASRRRTRFPLSNAEIEPLLSRDLEPGLRAEDNAAAVIRSPRR